MGASKMTREVYATRWGNARIKCFKLRWGQVCAVQRAREKKWQVVLRNKTCELKGKAIPLGRFDLIVLTAVGLGQRYLAGNILQE